jgi:hypothetical protein
MLIDASLQVACNPDIENIQPIGLSGILNATTPVMETWMVGKKRFIIFGS